MVYFRQNWTSVLPIIKTQAVKVPNNVFLKIDDCIAADDGHLVEFCVTQELFANIVTEPVSVELEEEKVINILFY
jgi:hypothetical protein